MTLSELKTAYDVLSATLRFPEDTELLVAPEATLDQRETYNRLQKLRSRFKNAYDDVYKNTEKADQNRKKAAELIEKFIKIITGERKTISQILKVDSSSTVRQITVAYTWYVHELTEAAGAPPFTNVAEKNYKGSAVSENEKKDLALYLEITRINQHFDKLYKRLIDEKAIQRGVSFNNRDSSINSTEFSPKPSKSNESEEPKKTATEESKAPTKEDLGRYETAFAVDMQKIIRDPNSADFYTIVLALRKIVKIDPVYFKLYRHDLSFLESMMIDISFDPEKWTEAHLKSQLPRILAYIVKEATQAIIGNEIKKSKENGERAKEKFARDIDARSRLGMDQLISFLNDHAAFTGSDGSHTKKTIDAASKLANLLNSARHEMKTLDFLDFQVKYNNVNIRTLFSHELSYLRTDFSRDDLIRNGCITVAEGYAKPLFETKVKSFIETILQSGRSYDATVSTLQDNILKHPTIRLAWKSLDNARRVFTSDKTKTAFRNMSDAEIAAGRLADYDDAQINWENILDPQFRSKLKDYFRTWARSEQKQWQKEGENTREDLRTLLHRFIIDAIPYYVDSELMRSMSIQDTLSEEKRKRLRESILKRVAVTVESELASIDSSVQTMSVASVAENLAFVKQESRFNLGSVQNIIVNNLKFEFLEGEKQGETGYGASRIKNKLSPSLFLALSHMSRVLYAELDTIKKAANFAIDSHGRIAQHPTLFIDPTPRGDLQRPNEKIDAYRSRQKKHFTENMIALLYARLIADQNPPIQNEKVRNRNSVARRFNLPEKIYFSELDMDDQSMLYEVKKEAVDYLIQIGFAPADIQKVDKGLALSPERASLIKTANEFLLNGEQKVELLDPDLVVTRRPPSENLALGEHTKGHLSAFDVDPYLGREYEWNRPVRLGDDRLSPATRVERIKKFLKVGSIEYNLTGTYGFRELHSGLKKRTNNASLPLFPFTLPLPIGEFLNDKDIQKIEASAQDTYTDRRTILKRIQELLADSDKMRNFVQEYNIFVGTLMDEAVKDPNAFLQKVGVGANPNIALAPEAWLTIFFDISYGRFASLEQIQKSSNIKAARQYGLRLRNNPSA